VSLELVLDVLVLGPFTLLYRGVFDVFVRTVGPGAALVLFALTVNALLLPVYAQMETRGQAARQRRAAMDAEIARVSRAFKGRERYYYVQTIRRHFGYRPLSSLFDASDLAFQVVVFITVYRFLVAAPELQGASFGPIADLGRPDTLLAGGHLLPLLMTAANVISVSLYTEDRSKRRQGFVLATVFLALLYSSPAGLVLYWTTNNVASLVRNVVMRRVVPILPLSISAQFVRLASEK
jgi:membrane protein insertase Oxa1/YidC/SpoIIIJ